MLWEFKGLGFSAVLGHFILISGVDGRGFEPNPSTVKKLVFFTSYCSMCIVHMEEVKAVKFNKKNLYHVNKYRIG
jgi:hypothetical protein